MQQQLMASNSQQGAGFCVHAKSCICVSISYLAKGRLILPCVTRAAVDHVTSPVCPWGTVCACAILACAGLEASTTLTIPLHTKNLASIGAEFGDVEVA